MPNTNTTTVITNNTRTLNEVNAQVNTILVMQAEALRGNPNYDYQGCTIVLGWLMEEREQIIRG